MKRIFTFIVLSVLSVSSIAQSEKYMAAMKQNKQLFDSAKTTDDFKRVASVFERIGDAEKTQWLPYYYAALAHATLAFRDKKTDADELAVKVNDLIAKAEAINRNADICVIKFMIASLQMQVNPMSRWQQYGGLMSAAIEEGKKLNPANPRIYLMEGQNLFYTPESFGGGKAVAKPVFQKAVELYNQEKPASEIDPSWGKKQAEDMLAKCQ